MAFYVSIVYFGGLDRFSLSGARGISVTILALHTT